MNLLKCSLTTFLLFATIGQLSAQIDKTVSVKDQNLKAKLAQDSVGYGNVTGKNSMKSISAFTNKGQVFDVLYEKQNFYFITDGGGKGWVFKSAVELLNSTPSTPIKLESPELIWKELEALGLHTETKWEKSDTKNEWQSTWKFFNHNGVSKLTKEAVGFKPNNEVSVQLFGSDANTVGKFIVTAKTYSEQDKNQAISTAIECLNLFVAPTKIIDSFRKLKDYDDAQWQITIKKHKKYMFDSGFDIECISNSPLESIRPINEELKAKIDRKRADEQQAAKEQQAAEAKMRAERNARSAKLARQRKEARAAAARKKEEELNVKGLVLMTKTVTGTNRQFGGDITGIVVNRTGRKLGYAQITFNLYDSTGAQIGSALANINGLEPNGRWRFKAATFQKFSRYRFSELEGF